MSGKMRAVPLGKPFQEEFLDNVRCFDTKCIDSTESASRSSHSANSSVATVHGDLELRRERKNILQRVGIATQNLTTLTFSRATSDMCSSVKHRRGTSRNSAILGFIRDYGVRVTDFDTACVSPLSAPRKKCSEDNYFSRKLSRANLAFLQTQLQQLVHRFVLFSPASCRTLFGTFSHLKAMHIRGKRTTVHGILDRSDIPVYNRKPWFVVVSRLAPVDYHRVHSPVAGKILSIATINNRKSSAYSVDPTIVRNSSIDVFVHNHRIVVTIGILDVATQRVLGPTVYVVIVGATCVNSIRLSNLRVDQLLRVGDELAAFHYGGSTVLTLFVPPEPKLIASRTHGSLVANLARKHETYLEVGAPILAKINDT